MTATATPRTPAEGAPRTVGRRRRARTLTIGLVVALAVLALAAGLSLAVGAKSIPLTDVWSALTQPDDSYASAVVASRNPRPLPRGPAGAALAVSGALIQGLTRTPLGDPGLLGINAGAAASVVTGTVVLGAMSPGQQVWAAIPGALLTAVVVYLLGSAGRGSTPVRLVL